MFSHPDRNHREHVRPITRDTFCECGQAFPLFHAELAEEGKEVACPLGWKCARCGRTDTLRLVATGMSW
jgi:DNA-directed RNA polymerase subunit RPC12/RpoP